MDQEKESKMSMSIPLSIVVAGFIIAGAIIFAGTQNGEDNIANVGGEATPEVEDTKINLAGITLEDHVLGNRNALVTIVEFSDLECPFCKTHHVTMKKIIEEYGEKGEVAWVYRHFPLESIHPKARDEALASECAASLGGEVAFWNYIDKVFEVTPSNNGLDLALLPQLAEDIGLSRKDFEQCMEKRNLEKKIDEDIEEALAAGARGTPYSIILSKDGEPIPLFGAQPASEIKKTIDKLLADE